MKTILPQMITNSLCTDSVIMKPRCVSSCSSGSLESIAQMHVHDIAVLTTCCNTWNSTMWQVVGASCCSKSYAKISYCSTRYPTCLATCFVDMSASSMPIARSRKLLGILGILKMLQCKKLSFLNKF